MRRPRLAVLAVLMIVATACGGGGEGDEVATGTHATTPETASATTPATTPPATTARATPTPVPESEPVFEEPTDGPAAAALPNTPEGHVGETATIGTLPDLPTGDGVTVVAMGPPWYSSIPMLVHNGTDGPISLVEVSGLAVDGDGETITSGASQGFLPPVIEPDGYTFGWVFVDTPDDLPPGAHIPDPTVDYNEGAGSENMSALDVIALEPTAGGATGEVENPNDAEVRGPISVYIACFDADGQFYWVQDTFAHREPLPGGETSTFDFEFYDRRCDPGVAAAAGF